MKYNDNYAICINSVKKDKNNFLFKYGEIVKIEKGSCSIYIYI